MRNEIRLSVGNAGANTTSFKSTDVNTAELLRVITTSNYSPISWKNGYRAGKNFSGASGFAVDIDNGLSLQDAKARIEKEKIHSFLVTTKSHQKEKGGKVADRFRILIPFHRAVYTTQDYKRAVQEVVKLFPECDKAVQGDTARMYYISPADCVSVNYFDKTDFHDIYIDAGLKGVPNAFDDSLEVRRASDRSLSFVFVLTDERTPIYCPFCDDFEDKEKKTNGTASAVVWGDEHSISCSHCVMKYYPVKPVLAEKQAIKVWDKDELKNANLPPLVELIEGVMSDEGVYLFAGQDKSGKSLFAMNLALAIASDRPKFLDWNIKKHGPVVYWNNELSDRQMKRRLNQMDIPTSHPVKFINEKGVRFDENIEEILDICKQYNPVLVIVDCHYRVTTKDKDYGNAIQAVLENYGRIKEEVGCTLLVIHHTKKSARGERAGSEQAMGSHTFAMSSDGNFQMKRSETDPEKRIVFDTGNRDFSDFKPRLIQLNELNLWFGDLGECDEVEHMKEQNMRKTKNVDEEYAVKVLESRNSPLMKQDLISAIMNECGVGHSTAYESYNVAFKAGKIAENGRHVVTLVKMDEDKPSTVPELVLEG